MKIKTLKIALFKSLALPIIFSILIIGAAGYWSASEEISEVYDSQLITAANLLWMMNTDGTKNHPAIKMQEENLNLDETDRQALDEYAKWRSFRVWQEGRLVMSSDNARPASIPPAPKGFRDITIEGRSWRIFTLIIPKDQITVEVGEDQEARSNIIGNILSGLIWPLLFAFPVIAFLIWKGIHYGLKELHRFARDIKRRSPDDLSRLADENMPAELMPLTESINQLLGKLETSLAQERLFTDNAAHELRTPLAALQVQTQVILNSKDMAQRDDAVRELAKGTKRASRLLDQLLTLAHLRYQPVTEVSLNLYMEAREVIKTSFPAAAKKGIEIDLSGDELLQINSPKELLLILIGNIVDNAIKYTPAEGKVSIFVGRINGKPTLTVTDTGPGIPPEERVNVFQRFYRLPNNIQAGSGLGLAICKQIAEILHIDIAIETPPSGHGLMIKLIFTN